MLNEFLKKIFELTFQNLAPGVFNYAEFNGLDYIYVTLTPKLG